MVGKDSLEFLISHARCLVRDKIEEDDPRAALEALPDLLQLLKEAEAKVKAASEAGTALANAQGNEGVRPKTLAQGNEGAKPWDPDSHNG